MRPRFSILRSGSQQDQRWHPFLAWFLVVALAGTLGSFGGLLVGKLLYRISYDYIVIPQEHQDWGLRFGLFAGTALVAAQSVGRRSPFSITKPLLALLAVGVITGIAISCGGLIAHQLYQTGLWQPVNWQLPNPSRHAILVGAIIGRNWGAGSGLTLAILALRYYLRPMWK